MTTAISNFMAFSGYSMMIGMGATAIFNSSLAASSEYKEKCDRVKKLTEAIMDFQEWAKGSNKIFSDQGFEIQQVTTGIATKTAIIGRAMKDNKQKQDKILKKTRLISGIITTIISFLLILKTNLANF